MSDDRDLRVLRYLVERGPGDEDNLPRDEDEPVDPALEGRLVRSAMRAWAKPSPRATAGVAAPPSAASPVDSSMLPLKSGKVTKSASLKKATACFSLIAAAAAALIFLGTRPPVYPAIGEYGSELKVEGAHLGAPRPGARLTPKLALDVVARPKEPILGPVEINAWIVSSSGITRWSPRFEVSTSGVFHTTAAASQLPVTEGGDYSLVMLIGRPGAMPTEEQARRLVADPRSASTPSLVIVRDVIYVDSE